jgi:deazaflavin-dependent oxidoreductase (nitroreductase family)
MPGVARTIDRVYARLHRLWMPAGRRQTWFDRWGVRFSTRADVWFFRRFGWSALARMMGVDVLLLRTRGRKTGQRREAMVACIERDGHLLVGGGNWGWDRNPGWYHNVLADPDVEVVRRRQTRRMRAQPLDGAELERAQAALAEAYPHSQVYVNRRTRPIPAVRFDPVD